MELNYDAIERVLSRYDDDYPAHVFVGGYLVVAYRDHNGRAQINVYDQRDIQEIMDKED